VHERFEKSYKLDPHAASFRETPHTPSLSPGAIRSIEDLREKSVPAEYALPFPRSLSFSPFLQQSDTSDQILVNPLLFFGRMIAERVQPRVWFKGKRLYLIR
jgi:hypothetical protein